MFCICWVNSKSSGLTCTSGLLRVLYIIFLCLSMVPSLWFYFSQVYNYVSNILLLPVSSSFHSEHLHHLQLFCLAHDSTKDFPSPKAVIVLTASHLKSIFLFTNVECHESIKKIIQMSIIWRKQPDMFLPLREKKKIQQREITSGWGNDMPLWQELQKSQIKEGCFKVYQWRWKKEGGD